MKYTSKVGDIPMKVFISWSGSKSQEVAKILKQWIPCVIQSVEPYFSSADIDKGARWSTDIAKELQDASFGILCVTKENLSSAWLNFEAGALSKSIEQSKVCPFLVDLKPSDIQNSPILQFQMASATKDDVFRLFKSINQNIGDASLNENVLSTTFDIFWPKIEEALKSVSTIADVAPVAETTSKDIQVPIEEILELVRYQHKLLKSPSELLPPDYLREIIIKSERGFPREYREYIMELDERAHQIAMLASTAIDGCMLKEVGDSESLSCTTQLREISECAKRISMLARRISRSSKFLY